MKIKGKNITVVGLGLSGKAAAILLAKKGACVYATDSADSGKLRGVASCLRKKGIKTSLGTYCERIVKNADLIVVSPGIKDDAGVLKIASKMRIPAISEIELASWFSKSDIIAVTGTNGKSTIVTLIGLMLKASGKTPIVCGNIGKAFSGIVLSAKSTQPIVLETSSFQLKRIDRFKPKISLISNITQNHLDMHIDFKEYFSSKMNIYRNQEKDDFCVLNYDDKNLRFTKPLSRAKTYFYSLVKNVEGAFLDKSSLVININGRKKRICSADDIILQGKHNFSNALAASCCAYLAGVSPKAIRNVLSQFKGLPHRCEHVITYKGVSYVDDSKATSVDACAAALRAYPGKLLLIAGGRDKNSDFKAITGIIRSRVKSIIAIGEARDKIIGAFSDCTQVCKASCMEDAVRMAEDKAVPGDTVLLSPMCASFDMYNSYSERGMDFRRVVEKLKTKKSPFDGVYPERSEGLRA
jgi:UDP-N-acetylmuramoylalanine--D-glutamate ligase